MKPFTLAAIAILALLLVLSRRERPVVATWPQPPEGDDGLLPPEPREWIPLPSQPTETSNWWYEWCDGDGLN